MKAKKSLGQNFLKDNKILKKISDLALENVLVLEIGPGKGALTNELLKKNKVLSIEKDNRLIVFLNEKFLDINFKLIHGDILEFNFKKIREDYQIIANLPYYITGQFFRYIFSFENLPKQIVVLLQKEVVERINGKKNNLLKASLEVYSQPHKKFTISKKYFSPKPKIDSAILVLNNIKRDEFVKKHEKEFFDFLHLSFKRKRAQLQKNLKEKYRTERIKEIFNDLNIRFDIRAEDLTTEILKEIFLKFIK